MLTVRRAGDRGRTTTGWLDSRHTFSVGGYFDPAFTGFRTLRVLNDDRVAPGAGFGAHRHHDVEILSYVLNGELQHRDSTGHTSVLRGGEMQHLRAGTGITHSEFNGSRARPVHFLQMWIAPKVRGSAPAYHQLAVDDQAARAGFVLVASPDGRRNSFALEQDVDVWITRPEGGASAQLPIATGRHAWIHVARGSVMVNAAVTLRAGDGAALNEESRVAIVGCEQSEVLVFDLA